MTVAQQLHRSIAAELRSLRIAEARESSLGLPELEQTRREIATAQTLAAALARCSGAGTMPVAQAIIRALVQQEA